MNDFLIIIRQNFWVTKKYLRQMSGISISDNRITIGLTKINTNSLFVFLYFFGQHHEFRTEDKLKVRSRAFSPSS